MNINKQKYKVITGLSLIIGVMGLMATVALLPTFTYAAPSDLPLRRTPTPLDSNLPGGFIELQVERLQPGLWTRVQWQDALGSWHDIEGWQGTFDEYQRVLWWVGEEHLGEGPFRWLVYESQGGDLLAVSKPFYLPFYRGEVVRVTLSLPLTS